MAGGRCVVADGRQQREMQEVARGFGVPFVMIYQDKTPGLLCSTAERMGMAMDKVMAKTVLAAQGIEFAYPTQMLYVTKPDGGNESAG